MAVGTAAGDEPEGPDLPVDDVPEDEQEVRGTVLEVLAAEAGAALAPLAELISDPTSSARLLAALGWQAPAGTVELTVAVAAAQDLLAGLSAVLDAGPDDRADALTMAGLYGDLLVAITNLVGALHQAVADLHGGLLPPGYLQATRIKDELVRRLLDFLLVQYLRRRAPALTAALTLLGVVEEIEFPADPARFQPQHVRLAVRWDRLPQLLADPAQVFHDVYGWGRSDFDAVLLLERLGLLAATAGAEARLRDLPRAVEERLAGRSVPEADDDPVPQLFMSLLRWPSDTDPLDVGVSGFALRPTGPDDDTPGLAFLPYVIGTPELVLPLGARTAFVVDVDVELLGGACLLLRPGRPAQVVTGLDADGGLGAMVNGHLAAGIRVAEPEIDETTGEPRRMRLLALTRDVVLAVREVSVVVGARAQGDAGRLDPFIEIAFAGARLALGMSDADAVVAELTSSARQAAVDFDLVVGYSRDRGTYLQGSAGLETAIAVRAELGPLSIRTLHLAVRPEGDAVALEVSVSGQGRLGPVGVAVQRAGVIARLSLPSSSETAAPGAPGPTGAAGTVGSIGGNLGPVDLQIRPKAPSGLGIAIDGGALTGAGFLDHDPDTGRYAGMVVLGVNGTTISAVGLVDTDVPGTPSGYSFVLLVSAQFRPIRLGLGFTLNGVGGAAGMHRRLALDALRDGIKRHTVDSILFPEDPVANAARIISDLDTVFPPSPGRFVLGPMALIGWGRPPLVEAELGVILELPQPARLAVLGQLTVGLPTLATPIVDIHLDAVGTVDFAAKRLTIDATLYDSFIGAATLSGDMALRLAWGDDPRFALAIGGFHPQFPVPADFPPLRRLTVALSEADNPRLSLQAYIAVTSNTVQLGALAELYVEAGGFEVRGWLGFDALATLSPFGFSVAVTAGLTLSRNGTLLAGIWIDAVVSGPRPWRVVGQASVSVLFAQVTVPIELTIGAAATAQVAPADPRPLLAAALADPGSWSAALPAAVRQVVVLLTRTRQDVTGESRVVADPAGVLTFRQSVVPLGRRLDRFGAVAPVGPDRYTLDRVTIGGRPCPDVRPVQDHFAPAQFEALTEAQRLSRPSFELMDAGFSVFGPALDHGRGLAATPTYQTVLVDVGGRRDATPYQPPASAQEAADRRRADAEHPTDGSLTRYRPARTFPQLVTLEKERYVIVSAVDLRPRPDLAAPGTRDEVEQALAAHLARRPGDRGRLRVLPARGDESSR